MNTLLTAAVGMVIQPSGSWPQKMLLLAGVSLSAAGVRAERGITSSHRETDNSPPGDDDNRLAHPSPAALQSVTADATTAPPRNWTRKQLIDYPLYRAQLTYTGIVEVHKVPLLAEFIGVHVTRDFFNRIFHPLMMEALAKDKEMNKDPLLLSRFLQSLYQKLLFWINEIKNPHIASTRDIRQYLLKLHHLSLAMRREWADVIETTASDNDPLRSISWDYLYGAMNLSDLHDKYQEELGRITPDALMCELEVFLQNTVQDNIERSSMLSTLFFYPLSWLLTLKSAQHPP